MPMAPSIIWAAKPTATKRRNSSHIGNWLRLSGRCGRSLWSEQGGAAAGTRCCDCSGLFFCCREDFRPVLEMHRVVVVPLAAPDEAVPLEHLNDLPGNAVPVGIAAVRAGAVPIPVVG